MHDMLPKKDINLISLLLKSKESTLMTMLNKYLEDTYGKHNVFRRGNDFVYATGEIPVLMVAHLDTVLPQPPEQLYVSPNRRVWMNPSTGIGADDRAGVYAIMKILKSGRRPSVLFTTGEESGGLGAMAFVKEFAEPPVPTKYVIEIDRRGRGQAVYYDCGNTKFEQYITEAGFVTHQGVFSDISFICPDWNVAGVNVSAGYYDEHTTAEQLNVDDLFYTIECVEKLLDKAEEVEFYLFEPIPKVKAFYAKCHICGTHYPTFSMTKVGNDNICIGCTEIFINWCEECGKPFYGLTPEDKKCEVCADVV